MSKLSLSLVTLKSEAKRYSVWLNSTPVAELYGVTDGKAIGTYVEKGFRGFLAENYDFSQGNAALGLDFPSLMTDLKITSVTQPQSSCPYRDASQKVYGLGYNLLVMVYQKSDDHQLRVSQLEIAHLFFIPASRTADYQTTKGILEILRRAGNRDDIEAFLEERNLPLDEIGRIALAERILAQPPLQGYLTVSNALQWRLQYGRVIELLSNKEAIDLENLDGE